MEPFYMKQKVNMGMACGIIACVHSVMNNHDLVELRENSVLDKFYCASMGLDPNEKADLMNQLKELNEEHQDAAAQGQTADAGTQDHVNAHFVAFVINEQG